MTKKENKKNIIFSAIAGFLPAIFTVAGYMAKYNHGLAFSPYYIINFLCLWVAFSACVFFVYNLADYTAYLKKTDKISDKKPSKRLVVNENIIFLISVAALLIAWIPSFLALYPGIFAYDNQWQLDMFVNNKISTHQPVLHTLILGFIISTFQKNTGSINKGVASYIIFQMVVMGLGLSYIPYLLRRKGVKLCWIILSIIFFAFFPVIVIFIFTGTKDSIFSVAVADFMGLNLCLLSENGDSFFKKKKDAPIWALLAFVILTFRGNAVYALIPMIILLVIFVLRNYKKKLGFFITLLVLAILFIVFNYPISNAIAKEKVSKAEMLSVPCQQLSRVYHYHYDELDKGDIAAYDEFFDSKKWYGYYVPEIADASKGSLRTEVYESRKNEFYSLWFKWFKAYTKDYVDSVLENTYGLFYMWPKYVLYSYGQEGFTVVHPMQPAEANTKIPMLFKIFEQFENGDIVMRNRAVSWVFAPAIYFYIMIAAALYVVKKNRCGMFVPFAFLILLWMTFLLGPASLVRYVLFLYILIPVYTIVYTASSAESKLDNSTERN